MKKLAFDFISRLLIYSGLIGLAYWFFTLDTNIVYNNQKFSEISYTEYYQQILFLISAIISFSTAYKFKNARPALVLFGGFLLVSFFRELDFYTDSINTSFWAIPATIVITIVSIISWKQRKNLLISLTEFYNTKAFAFFFSGLLVTFLFSRLFGKSHLWMDILDENYVRSAKNAAEEGVELMGDILIFISTIEYFIFQKLKKH